MRRFCRIHATRRTRIRPKISKYNLPGTTQAIYVENHAEENIEIYSGKIHSLYIDKEALLKEELRGSSSKGV